MKNSCFVDVENIRVAKSRSTNQILFRKQARIKVLVGPRNFYKVRSGFIAFILCTVDPILIFLGPCLPFVGPFFFVGPTVNPVLLENLLKIDVTTKRYLFLRFYCLKNLSIRMIWTSLSKCCVTIYLYLIPLEPLFRVFRQK